jgi:hypothetical protein
MDFGAGHGTPVQRISIPDLTGFGEIERENFPLHGFGRFDRARHRFPLRRLRNG